MAVELQQQTFELENVRLGIALTASLAASDSASKVAADRATAQRCFTTARLTYRWFGVGIGLTLTVAAYVTQMVLPSAFKDVSAKSWLAHVGTAWWLPLLLFIVPTFAGMYEMPDIIFGAPRRRFSDFVFRKLLRWNGVSHAAADANWDYKAGKITFETV